MRRVQQPAVPVLLPRHARVAQQVRHQRRHPLDQVVEPPVRPPAREHGHLHADRIQREAEADGQGHVVDVVARRFPAGKHRPSSDRQNRIAPRIYGIGRPIHVNNRTTLAAAGRIEERGLSSPRVLHDPHAECLESYPHPPVDPPLSKSLTIDEERALPLSPCGRGGQGVRGATLRPPCTCAPSPSPTSATTPSSPSRPAPAPSSSSARTPRARPTSSRPSTCSPPPAPTAPTATPTTSPGTCAMIPSPSPASTATAVRSSDEVTVELTVVGREGARGLVASKRFKVNGVARRGSDAVGADHRRALHHRRHGPRARLPRPAPPLRRRHAHAGRPRLRPHALPLQQGGDAAKRPAQGACRSAPRKKDELDYWDDEMSREGAAIARERALALVDLAAARARSMHERLSGGREQFAVEYAARFADEWDAARLASDPAGGRRGRAAREAARQPHRATSPPASPSAAPTATISP